MFYDELWGVYCGYFGFVGFVVGFEVVDEWDVDVVVG